MKPVFLICLFDDDYVNILMIMCPCWNRWRGVLLCQGLGQHYLQMDCSHPIQQMVCQAGRNPVAVQVSTYIWVFF